MRIIVFAALLLLIKPLFAQELIYNSTPKKGIYKNFYEFKYNRPSISLDFPVIMKLKGPTLLPYPYNNDTLYFLELNKEDTSFLEQVYGFCDGNTVFKSLEGGKLTKKTRFSKISFLGRYSIYYGLMVNTLALTYYTEDLLVAFVIDVIDGEHFKITATDVDDLIKDDPALLEAFQKERNKELVAKDYIIRYCENNFERHIIKPLVNDSSLCKLETDTSFKAYYQRIIDFKIDTTIIDIELREYYYGKSKLKMIGLKAKHKRGKNEDYYYKIGAWRTYHKNGNLKSVVNYDFREKMNGSAQFIDKDGMLIEEKYFIHGKEIK